MIQTSCSELLVDTGIFEPAEALERFSELFQELGWSSSPKLTLGLLEHLKEVEDLGGSRDSAAEILVFDSEGNKAYLEYGDNGYITTGYRLDSQCNDWDDKCYPIFKAAIEKLGGELMSCDGGSKVGYETWLDDNGA